MPFFRESDGVRAETLKSYVHGLQDSLIRNIPVTSIEFNPPAVSCLEKRELGYWTSLETPDEEDRNILKALRLKLKHAAQCHRNGSFISITDSAAGILRLHNLTMVRLFANPVFTEQWLGQSAIVWEPRRTMLHLTRNHSVAWIRWFLKECRNLSFINVFAITGDPLAQVKLPTVTADKAMDLSSAESESFRLKNSVELVKFIQAQEGGFYVGVAHNPFMKKEPAEKHFLNKVEAGARFIVTQPVSYYDSCWDAFADFEAFRKANSPDISLILGVFNYFVRCSHLGYDAADFENRRLFWKKLFGFVPDGVKRDYEAGLSGIEIMARSIIKLKSLGYYHFDVMNAERMGWSVVHDGQRITHERDRLARGVFDA